MLFRITCSLVCFQDALFPNVSASANRKSAKELEKELYSSLISYMKTPTQDQPEQANKQVVVEDDLTAFAMNIAAKLKKIKDPLVVAETQQAIEQLVSQVGGGAISGILGFSQHKRKTLLVFSLFKLGF